MKKRRLLKRATGYGLVLAMLSLPLLSGCAVGPNAGQLTMLEEARKAAESAEADLEACKQRRADLERQLTQRKQTLAEWQNIQSSVQQSLSQ